MESFTIRKKKFIFLSICVLLTTYILWIFYLSEPNYINNIDNKTLEVYDYVSIPKHHYEAAQSQEVNNGIVLQTDSVYALVLVKQHSDKFIQLKIDYDPYRIVGRGTIYHKINQYVGFNIMLITQIFIGILLAILIITTVKLFSSIID